MAALRLAAKTQAAVLAGTVLPALAGALGALPAGLGALASLAWLRWRVIPWKTVALEVASSSREVFLTLLPAAAVGAACGGTATRRVAWGAVVSLLAAAPGTALLTGRRVVDVLQAAGSRPVDFAVIATAGVAGGMMAAALAAWISDRARGR
ncbi:MAG: hypothetical protein HPY55_12230 [Firmicutes bacterium]|nr:hypothetical protein [Bacillota bacterium]